MDRLIVASPLVHMFGLRILIATIIGAIGKLFGKKGWFYIVAGEKASGIDGPCHYTLSLYNNYVALTPKNPNKVVGDIEKITGKTALIVDINDLGGKILGSSNGNIDLDLMVDILKDNPLGQCNEQTPMGIIRFINEEKNNEDIAI